MSLPTLDISDFADIFQAIHGVPPFPWQTRLAARLAAGEGWPKVFDLPTGTGKTAALDAALFRLALEADRGPHRRAPVRIAFVVDRRIVVDAAFARATVIADALVAAVGDGPLARMAARLRHLAGGGTARPLMVRVLRGGLPREDDWARSPGQPTVLCSTVDQVGSRLLFRGYGISDSMKPVHAGLLGSDCLLLLDEAHLSTPFVQTLKCVSRYRRPDWCEHEPGPWEVVTLSATPRGPKPDFGLEQDDRDHPVLACRLRAAKPTTLQALPFAAKDERHRNPLARHAEAFTEAAVRLRNETHARRLAVVVNRVALARTVFEMLRARLGENAEVVLLTGRIREHDRAALLARYGTRLLSGTANDAGEKPLVVVATQTIEAGADFDFDVLVTQIAPLDALRQRFGRLNRIGREITARAVILAARDEIGARANDPVYGDRAKKTWDWLQSIAEAPAKTGGEREVDFSIEALAVHLSGVDVEGMSARQADAPILRPADVLLLSWTAPVPAVDPDVAPFLHGPQTGPADVQLVWRADVMPEDLDQGATHLPALLSLAPPHTGEVLSVPLWAARAWLAHAGAEAAETPDLEGTQNPAQPDGGGRPAFRWAGPDAPRTGVVRPAEVQPGDVLVVPAAYGGCDEHGWDPESTAPVQDLGDALPAGTRWERRRLHKALFEEATDWARVRAAIAADDRDRREQLEQVLDALGLTCPEGRAGWALHRIEGYDGAVLVRPRRVLADALEAATEDDEAGLIAPDRRITLTEHTNAVVRHAAAFATAAGLSPERVADIALAAELHDIGKADPRFQTLLHGGDRLAVLAATDEPLAKARLAMNRTEIAAAWRAAGLPERWRHEARSVAVALTDPRLARAADPALVLWLIGTHHGHGRPLFPHHDPHEPEGLRGPQRLDFTFEEDDWPQLYERLKARYGPWELARLEAVLRLADHRASAEAAP